MSIGILAYAALGILIGILLFLFIRSHTALSNLKAKYGQIIDVDAERAKIQQEIASLTAERDKVKSDFHNKKDKLKEDYDKAHVVFERLQREISLLEESLEMIEFGLYKPHFDFDTPEVYRGLLENLREIEKTLIREGRAVVCDTQWTVSGSEAEGRKMTKQTHKLMLRAFNGECDAALAKVRWDNILKIEERINKAFQTINSSAEVNRSHITKEYFDYRIKELRLAFEYQEKLKREKEEQRRIQEEMREEDRARREIERAKEEAEKEAARYLKALEKAREDVGKATGEKLDTMNERIAQLEGQLKAAQELREKAISRAQITKSGHVYVISNIGSFGESVYKIGMTRRLEPTDRIRELGDASVPFNFDIHAMVYSDNAPELELKIHQQFETRRINLVNQRREFYDITLDEIEEWAKEQNIELRLTKIAEAREYRETLAIRAKGEEAIRKAIKDELPISIDDLFSKEEDDVSGM